jgi:hypothetical protein
VLSNWLSIVHVAYLLCNDMCCSSVWHNIYSVHAVMQKWTMCNNTKWRHPYLGIWRSVQREAWFHRLVKGTISASSPPLQLSLCFASWPPRWCLQLTVAHTTHWAVVGVCCPQRDGPPNRCKVSDCMSISSYGSSRAIGLLQPGLRSFRIIL